MAPPPELGLRSRLRTLAVVPGLMVMVLLSAVWAVHVLVSLPLGWIALAVAVGCGAVLAWCTGLARAVEMRCAAAVAGEAQLQRAEYTARVKKWLQNFESEVAQGRNAIAWTLDQVEGGEQPVPETGLAAETRSDEPFADFNRLLRQVLDEAVDAVAQAAKRGRKTGWEPEQAEVFVSIAKRLHALNSRTLAALSRVENEIVDPDFLHEVLTLDHLVTLQRRQVENLAVLGGATPRRVLTPVPLPTVLRQARAEIEEFARARVAVLRPEVSQKAFAGSVGPDVIHLLAELVENGTKFSPVPAKVMVRAELVGPGVVIEVEDRGPFPMSPGRRKLMNQLLAAPQEVDLHEQLQEGHIGLLVAALLAQKHDVRVTLGDNELGGMTAVVIVPHAKLVDVEDDTSVAGAVQPSQSARPARVTDSACGSSPGLEPAVLVQPRRPQRPDAAAGQSAVPPLPQRARYAAPAPGTAGSLGADSAVQRGAEADSRPALPGRSAVSPASPQAAAAQQLPPPSGPPTAGLMGSYAAGVREGTEANGPAASSSADPTS